MRRFVLGRQVKRLAFAADLMRRDATPGPRPVLSLCWLWRCFLDAICRKSTHYWEGCDVWAYRDNTICRQLDENPMTRMFGLMERLGVLGIEVACVETVRRCGSRESAWYIR